MTASDHAAARAAVARALDTEFLPAPADGAAATPFVHGPSGHRFRYVPQGSFRMGLSPAEKRAARAIFDPVQANLQEMRPVHEERVGAFLVAERPVLTREVRPAETRYADSAAYVTDDEALAFCERMGMTLPTEAQWEYACRAGSQTLFTWGDTLPAEDELADWLTFDFAAGNGRANAFGLHGLYVGEWCLDRFRPDYATPAAADAPRVVRGGGAFFWPWQDQEWVWCMSAMRLPATDLPDGRCAFRFVRNL